MKSSVRVGGLLIVWLFAVAGWQGRLCAQLTHSVTAANTFKCEAGPNRDSIPAGTSLAPSASMSTSYRVSSPWGPVVCANVSGTYEVQTSPQRLSFKLDDVVDYVHLCSLSNASVGVNETLWVIQSPQQVTGLLSITSSSAIFGAILEVDIDDDGTVDWSLASPGPLRQLLTIPGSRTIRIRSHVGLNHARAELTFSTVNVFGAGCGPLMLDSTNATLGSNWTLSTTGVDALAPTSVTFFGDRGQPVSLVSLGIPAICWVHLQSITASRTATNVGGAATLQISVPSNPSLLGVVVAAQSACFTTANAGGVHTSNGLEVVISS